MQYITGIFALNLPCELNTTGDWHTSALDWDKIKLYDSKKSIFDDYGIESNRTIPEHTEVYNVANHIRAILDLLETKSFSLITNFQDEYICDAQYIEEIFRQVQKLLPNNDIYNFMHKVYGRRWRLWIGGNSTKKC